MEPVEQTRNMNNLFMVLTISLNLVTTAYSQGHHDDIRLIQFSPFDRVNHTKEEYQEFFGCRHVLPTGYFAGKRNMAACMGSWTGHVKDSDICAPSWHVCSSKDKEVFDGLQYSNLMRIGGCYAMNAAHVAGATGGCSDCGEGENVIMTGAGRHCPSIDELNHGTCINTARVDLRWSLRQNNESACVYHEMMTGAICCRDTPIEDPPQLINHGLYKHLVTQGESLRLECKAKGETQPKIVWRKNGMKVSTEDNGISISSSVIENITVSTLTIASASSTSNNAQYSCLATSKYGSDIGVQHQVTVWNLNSRKRGCRSGVRQTVLPGGEIFACEGKWKGHIKDASNRLCGKKYSVCQAYSDGMRIFDKVNIRETRILPGCYALDAASTKRSYCDRCNPKHKDNRMSGIGNDCAGYDPNTPSCLGQGRVDVWPHSDLEFLRSSANYTTEITEATRRAQQSCKYNAELTTGVLCCKSPTRGPWRVKVCTPKCRGGGRCIGKNTCLCPMERSGDRCEIKLLETRSCEEVCGANATCNKKKTKCKCLKGFKLSRNKCIPK